MEFEGDIAGSAVGSGMAGTREPAVESSQSESQSQPMSAVELARAAQQAAKPEPQEARETKSAVELAKEAQENAVQKKAEPISETEEELSEDDLNFDELDLEEESEESQSPSIEELKAQLDGVRFAEPSSYTGQLKNLLSNANIFGINLYEAGIGDKIEELFVEEIAGKGAVRATLKKYL